MRRLHLFEFNDQPWLPHVFRDAMTGYMETVSSWMGFSVRMAPLVEEALERSGVDRIVDLCSGSGGPILEIRTHLKARTPVVLTDKFPNRTLAIAVDGVTVHTDPVDALDVPAELTGMRTIMNALHQFPPEAARQLLSDAAYRRAPFLSIDITERSVLPVLTSPLIIPFVLLTMPFVRPTRWQYWVFTYLVPVLPVLIFWDGLVSNLRAHSIDELEVMTRGLSAPDYRWYIRRVALGAGTHATVIGGYPIPGK